MAQEKVWHLKHCDLFQAIPEERLAELEQHCRARMFRRGSPIYLPADQADGVLLLASGRAKICSFTHEGKQAILAFIEPGELFGELAIFDRDEREEYAEALDACTVVLIPGAEMRQIMEEIPQVALGVTKIIGLRRRRIERRLKSLLFKSNRERLVHLLLELAEQYGTQTPEGTELGIKLSHQDLANVIGSTRETATVVLGELQAQGHLKLGRRKIVIRDLQRLAGSANLAPPKVQANG